MFYKGPKIWSYFSAKCNPYIDSLKNYLEKHFSKPLKFCLKHANFKTISVILFCTYVGGAAISILCRYSLLIYTLVYISLGMIALASITAEKIFYKMMKDMQGRLLGHSVSYNHNKQIAILSAQATRELDIPGDMIFKIIEPLILFGVLGLLLLEYYPPILVLVYFLALFVCAVTFAMIGYHQYNTLLNYITLLSQKYEPSKRAINWMTAEQNLWLVKLSQAFDFMSCAFFVIGLLFAIACCGFCFHPAFGVLSNASIIRNVFFLMFWGKILWELAVKYFVPNVFRKEKSKIFSRQNQGKPFKYGIFPI